MYKKRKKETVLNIKVSVIKQIWLLPKEIPDFPILNSKLYFY